MKFKTLVMLSLFSTLGWAQESQSTNELHLSSYAGGGLWSDGERSSENYSSFNRAWTLRFNHQSAQRSFWSFSLDAAGGRLREDIEASQDLAFMQFKAKAAYGLALIKTENFRFNAGLQFQSFSRIISENESFKEDEPFQHFSRQGLDLRLGAVYNLEKLSFRADVAVPIVSYVDLSAPAANSNLSDVLLERVFGNLEYVGWHQYFATDLSAEVHYSLSSWFALSAHLKADMHIMDQENDFAFSDAQFGIGANFKF